ncbi:MAG: DUF3180 domain-containing protein [Actinobacteria bacterium]|nr:DUF3180 domain-containing protein [Actinomycetota bacterium]
MKQTKISTLAVLAILATSVGWSLSQLWPTLFGQGMPVSTGSAIAMVLVFVTLLIWTLMTRARLKPDATLNRLHPIVAARTAALAMSASRVGSLACGFYVGVLLANVAAEYSSAGTDRIQISAVTAVASLLTAIVAVWLERICQIKEPPADSDTVNGSRA